jgi:hypothetical protein
MKGRGLTGLLIMLGFGLGVVLLSRERSISRVMERCGELISIGLGL